MSNEEVLYVRTPSVYGDTHSAKYIIPNKIYKITKSNNNYLLPSDYINNIAITICLKNCIWIGFNDWQLATESEYNKQENIVKEDTKKLSRADCFREYARVIEMCEGTSIAPNECIKLDGVVTVLDRLSFLDKNTVYTFALRIHEGRPVFEGDILYNYDGGDFKASKSWSDDSFKLVSWTKPEIKKTCLLNGEELPLADGNFRDYGLTIEVYYMNKEDRNKVRDILTKLLKGEQQ